MVSSRNANVGFDNVDVIDMYRDVWVNHRSLLSEQGPDQLSKPTRQECIAEHRLRYDRHGHSTSKNGCRGGTADVSGWEMVDGIDEEEWSEVTEELEDEG